MNYTAKNIEDKLPSLNILIIGDVMIDHYINGKCSRISPEAPVPVVLTTSEEYTLGGAGNVFQNLVSLGCRVNLLSVSGDDENGKRITKLLKGTASSESYIIRDPKRCTTIKSRVLVSNHQMIRIDNEVTTRIDERVEKQVFDRLTETISDYNMVLISDYSKGFLTDCLLEGIFNLCKKNNVTTIVDPKGESFLKYRGADFIKPNKKEAIIASGIEITDINSVEEACLKLIAQTKGDGVIITMSEDGIASYKDNDLNVSPTKVIDVVDVTGAGDTVLASLGIALGCNLPLIEACDFANHVAAVVVSKVGSETATWKEIHEKYKNS
ncbi:hypothetical protein I5M32_14110 [Pedobacter sp. SD-b]|uniref:Carbohydrate kinase PfkB domain-containing protein n=1 Tax=Pedobacter segetis TaxID=2793069 RepID=A0ABS1BMJ3_9SPHI|nr:bifunctional ADP-heptose synthase [Pedobacter segetis]MBK0384100.1 hypothetical protein [Pedobacter segetis]